MAALIVRALGLDGDGDGDLFQEDDDSIYDGAIDSEPPESHRTATRRPTTNSAHPTSHQGPEGRLARAGSLPQLFRHRRMEPPGPPGEIVSETISGKASANGCVVIEKATLRGDIDSLSKEITPEWVWKPIKRFLKTAHDSSEN